MVDKHEALRTIALARTRIEIVDNGFMNTGDIVNLSDLIMELLAERDALVKERPTVDESIRCIQQLKDLVAERDALRKSLNETVAALDNWHGEDDEYIVERAYTLLKVTK